MGSFYPSISTDGRYIAFDSEASNLVSDDTNGVHDVFVHDREFGETTRVSVSDTGIQGNLYSGIPSISANGNYVSFGSEASNLITGDTNNYPDIFVNLREPYSISGTILTEDLTAVTDVTISLIDSSDLVFRSVINDIDGNYSLTGIPSGTYLLKPWKNGYFFTPEYLYVTVPADAIDQNFTAVPIGHSPELDEKLTTSKVTFTWDAIPDAIKYKLQLSTKPDFSVLLLNVRTTEPTYFFDTFLQYSKTYYWRIKPIFADSKVPWLSTWQFTSMDRLIKPELLSPDHNQILDSSEVTLFWNPVENAVKYKVIIAKDALFTNKVAARSTESTSEMFNLPDGRYYWKVKAIDLYGTKSPWSDYRIFKVNVP